MREIRFRAWLKRKKEFFYMDARDLYNNCNIYNDLPITQFTGKLDMQNKEIYEGDIVRGICSTNPAHVCEGLQQSGMMGKEVTGVVKYSNVYAQFYVTTDDITYLDLANGITTLEVIGNEHEQKCSDRYCDCHS